MHVELAQALDPVLVGRLRRPEERPGVIDPGLARALATRHQRMAAGLPLAELVMRHTGSISDLAGPTVPIVYALPSQPSPSPGSGPRAAQLGRPAGGPIVSLRPAQPAVGPVRPAHQAPRQTTPGSPSPAVSSRSVPGAVPPLLVQPAVAVPVGSGSPPVGPVPGRPVPVGPELSPRPGSGPLDPPSPVPGTSPAVDSARLPASSPAVRDVVAPLVGQPAVAVPLGSGLPPVGPSPAGARPVLEPLPRSGSGSLDLPSLDLPSPVPQVPPGTGTPLGTGTPPAGPPGLEPRDSGTPLVIVRPAPGLSWEHPVDAQGHRESGYRESGGTGQVVAVRRPQSGPEVPLPLVDLAVVTARPAQRGPVAAGQRGPVEQREPREPVAGRAPVGGRVSAAARDAGAPHSADRAAQPRRQPGVPVDVEQIVDTVHRRFVRRLAIEAERRAVR